MKVARQAAVLRAQGVDADHRIESGTWPAESILRWAASSRPHFIAMATHGQHALVRMLAGSTTSEVLRRASVLVLTVRPSALLH